MMKTDKATLTEIERLLAEYTVDVQKAPLSNASRSFYLDFADCFVRWIRGNFSPGLMKHASSYEPVEGSEKASRLKKARTYKSARRAE